MAVEVEYVNYSNFHMSAGAFIWYYYRSVYKLLIYVIDVLRQV